MPSHTSETAPVMLRVPHDLNAQIRAAAKSEQITLSEFIRRAMRDRLKSAA